jgi:hypothetical protein
LLEEFGFELRRDDTLIQAALGVNFDLDEFEVGEA